MRNLTKKRKRKLSEWNLFVMKVKKANPNMTFKQVLKKASAERGKTKGVGKGKK